MCFGENQSFGQVLMIKNGPIWGDGGLVDAFALNFARTLLIFSLIGSCLGGPQKPSWSAVGEAEGREEGKNRARTNPPEFAPTHPNNPCEQVVVCPRTRDGDGGQGVDMNSGGSVQMLLG